MARIRVSLEGAAEMKRTLRGVAVEMPKVARAGARTVGERKLVLAQERAPRKTGKMIDTARVTVSIRKAGANPNILASIRFTQPYSALQHETHPTKSKFLESVLREAVSTAGAELAQEITLAKAAAGGGS